MLKRYLSIIFIGAITQSCSAENKHPTDDLRLQFEAVSRMPEEEKRIVKALLEGMIVKYQTKQMIGGLSS